MLRGHAAVDRHAGVLAACLLLLLEVLVVSHLLLLLIRHVAGVHARATHVGLWRIDAVVGDVLGSLGGDIGGVDTILAGGRVWRIQAGLRKELANMHVQNICLDVGTGDLPESSSCPQPW